MYTLTATKTGSRCTFVRASAFEAFFGARSLRRLGWRVRVERRGS